MKLFCHRATVGGLVAQHDDKILVIDEDAEVVLDDEPTGRNPGIHSILRPAIRIPIGPDNDLGQSINESFLPFTTVLYPDAVRNADPCCLHVLLVVVLTQW